MASYTIEDIEMIRKKSGISYQEAVSLLDYHNGDLARALIDLEKNGRLKGEENMSESIGNRIKTGDQKTGFVERSANLFQRLYRSRIKIHKDQTPIINVSVLTAGVCALLAPYLCIIGVVVSMLLGYKFSFSKMDSDFKPYNFEKMVKNAAQNAKNSVANVVRTISSETDKNQAKNEKKETVQNTMSSSQSEEDKKEVKTEMRTDNDDNPAEELMKQTKEIENSLDSFFTGTNSFRNAYSASAANVPTIQIPIEAESKEGSIRIKEDEDGFHSVTIE